MVKSFNVRLTKNHLDLTERELKLLETLVVKECIYVNVIMNRRGMYFNPTERAADQVFNHYFVYEDGLPDEQFENFQNNITGKLIASMNSCGFDDVIVEVIGS